MSKIPAKEYKAIIQAIPILCVDLVIQNAHGDYLLLKRKNEPLKGQWWVVGGRVLRNETIKNAVSRIAWEECGIRVNGLKLLGYYEEVFKKSAMDMKNGIHTVSIVYECTAKSIDVVVDDQSSSYKWDSTIPEKFINNVKKL